MSRRFKWILIALLIIAIIAFIAWRFINPTGPVLDPVNNEIRDRATKDWTALEASVDKNPLNDVFFGDMHVHTAYSFDAYIGCLLYTSPSPRDRTRSRMPSSA